MLLSFPLTHLPDQVWFGHVAKRQVQTKLSKKTKQTGTGQRQAKIQPKSGVGDPSKSPVPHLEVGRAFRVAREQLGWSQEIFAEKAGCAVGTVKNAEAGNHLQARIHKELVEAINIARAASTPTIEPLKLLYPSQNNENVPPLQKISATNEIGGSQKQDEAANQDVVSEVLAGVSSLPDFAARDIATQDELRRLWQIDCAAYGERSITFEQFLAQWQSFPHFPKALFFRDEIAAAIGILPTTEARMKDFAEGRVSEASLQDDPLGEYMIGNVNAWLIDGMVRNPKFPMAATRELVCSSILSWIGDGLMCYPLNIYAIGQNRRGMNLITRAGFKLIKTAESLPDGMPFYVLHVESESKLLRLLLERLRCYASIAP